MSDINLKKIIMGVLIPPLLLYKEKKMNIEFYISLICYITLLFPVSVIYTFSILGYENTCQNILCEFLPFIAIYKKFGFKKEFFISILLFLLFLFPGRIYAYYKTWNYYNSVKKLKININ